MRFSYITKRCENEYGGYSRKLCQSTTVETKKRNTNIGNGFTADFGGFRRHFSFCGYFISLSSMPFDEVRVGLNSVWRYHSVNMVPQHSLPSPYLSTSYGSVQGGWHLPTFFCYSNESSSTVVITRNHSTYCSYSSFLCDEMRVRLDSNSLHCCM